MNIVYDEATDSLYIHLSAHKAADSDEVAEGIVLDFAGDGTLVGIDIQHASRLTDLARLSFERAGAKAA